jgi:ATP-dependent DNA helicase RecG
MPEKQNIEYKKIWKDEYLKWICGFTNVQGGKIYIGKDDNGNVISIAGYKELMEKLGQTYFMGTKQKYCEV